VSGGSNPILFYLIAGESSGDQIGGALMRALTRKTDGRATFAGIGGEQMTAAGLESLVPMTELSLVGIDEIAKRLPTLVKHLKTTEQDLRRRAPDALITIDCPAFSLRVARRVRDLHIPLIHYVAPTVWAYAPARAREIARFLDHLLLLFPFEQPYFDAVGLPSTYVGPHILEAMAESHGSGFRATHGLAADAILLCVLMGSRAGEIGRYASVYRKALGLVANRRPDVHLVALTVPSVAEVVRREADTWPLPTIVIEAPDQKYAAMKACDVALAAAGTVTLELALCGVPAVVAGKVGWLALIGAVRGVTMRHVALPNWILDRPVMPEFVQHGCRARPIADAVLYLLESESARARQRGALAEVVTRLKADGRAPSDRAAETVLQVLADYAAQPETKEGP